MWIKKKKKNPTYNIQSISIKKKKKSPKFSIQEHKSTTKPKKKKRKNLHEKPFKFKGKRANSSKSIIIKLIIIFSQIRSKSWVHNKVGKTPQKKKKFQFSRNKYNLPQKSKHVNVWRPILIPLHPWTKHLMRKPKNALLDSIWKHGFGRWSQTCVSLEHAKMRVCVTWVWECRIGTFPWTWKKRKV